MNEFYYQSHSFFSMHSIYLKYIIIKKYPLRYSDFFLWLSASNEAKDVFYFMLLSYFKERKRLHCEITNECNGCKMRIKIQIKT